MAKLSLGCLLPTPRTAAALVLFVLTCIALDVYLSGHARRTLEAGETPAAFPLLVVTPQAAGPGHAAQIVRKVNLAEFLKTHPQYSYLVPAAEEMALGAQVRGLPPFGSPPIADPRLQWRTDFEVEERAEGRQSLRVDASNTHSVSTAWYEATSQEVRPRSFESYPRYLRPLTVVIYALGLNLAGWILFWIVAAVRGRFS